MLIAKCSKTIILIVSLLTPINELNISHDMIKALTKVLKKASAILQVNATHSIDKNVLPNQYQYSKSNSQRCYS